MEYKTKITIDLTPASAKEFIKYYNSKLEALLEILKYDNKQLALWEKSKDNQLINYQKNIISNRLESQKIIKGKIKFLTDHLKSNPAFFSYDITGKEFYDFKHSYLHSLHVEYNEQFANQMSQNMFSHLPFIEGFRNRDFFNHPLPKNQYIPYCATELYFENVPESLIERISYLGNKELLTVLLNKKYTQKAKQAIDKDDALALKISESGKTIKIK